MNDFVQRMNQATFLKDPVFVTGGDCSTYAAFQLSTALKEISHKTFWIIHAIRLSLSAFSRSSRAQSARRSASSTTRSRTAPPGGWRG